MDTSIEAIRAARRELDAVIKEIHAVSGHEDFLAAPTFDDVAKVAGPDHPLVYFAAADLGGLALVVRGEDVAHVRLDDLTSAVVRKHVDGHLTCYKAYQCDVARGRTAWRKALDDVAEWLWSAAVGPVLAELGPVSRAVFVPGGLLGLLPMHAAWTPDEGNPRGRHYALDALTITYVPNARALVAARSLAKRPAEAVVIVADPPHRPALEPLPLARVEAQLTEHAFPARPVTVQPDEATAERVLAEIAAADVAHLACHGFAELDAPLDSGLNLAGDEVLRLRDLLARRSKLRLAVLSACETSMLGTELPDEVVSLPTGLLQAGVGGVVASLWAVQDTSTALLMAEFYRQWRGERVAPPEALRAAQLWLRDSSNAQKSEFLLSRFDEGLLPAQPVTELVNAIFDRGAEDDSHLQAWAGFVYVGA